MTLKKFNLIQKIQFDPEKSIWSQSSIWSQKFSIWSQSSIWSKKINLYSKIQFDPKYYFIRMFSLIQKNSIWPKKIFYPYVNLIPKVFNLIPIFNSLQETLTTLVPRPMIAKSTNVGEKLAKLVVFKSVWKWECWRKAFVWIESEAGDKNTDEWSIILTHPRIIYYLIGRLHWL